MQSRVYPLHGTKPGRNSCPRGILGNIVDTRWGGHQGLGTQKWTAVGEARLPGLKLPLGTGPRLWPQGGQLCWGQSSQLFFLWGMAWRGHAGIASSAALRLLGWFFFFFSYLHFWAISVSLVGENKKHKRKQLRQSRAAPGARSGAGRHPAKHGSCGPIWAFPSFSPSPCSNSDHEPPSWPSAGSVRWGLAPARAL